MNESTVKKLMAPGKSLNLGWFQKAALLAGLFLFTLPAFCWAGEHVEKILISADRMQMNIDTGKSTYTGNVKISRGEMTLTGDKVTIQHGKDDVERITVFGNPVHYKHVSETAESISAQSEKMVYIASENKLIMTINAHLQQSGMKLNSHKIVYHTESQIAIAGGNDETQQSQRVNIILTPKKATP